MATAENHQEVVHTLAGSIRACLNALSNVNRPDPPADVPPIVSPVGFPCICLSLTNTTVSLTKVLERDNYFYLEHLLLETRIKPDILDKRLVSGLCFARHESDTRWFLCDVTDQSRCEWIDQRYVVEQHFWHSLAGSTTETSEGQLHFNCIVKQLLTQDALDDKNIKSLLVIVPESNYVTCVEAGLSNCTKTVERGRTVTHKDHVQHLFKSSRVIVCHETHLLFSIIRAISQSPLLSQQLHFVEGLRKHVCGSLSLDQIVEGDQDGCIDPNTAYAIGIIGDECPAPAGYYFFPDREAAMRDARVVFAVRHDSIVALAIMRKKTEVLQAKRHNKLMKCSLDRTSAIVERYQHVLDMLMRAADH